MPSPFPGMDPYLEDSAYWSGFHLAFNVAIVSALNRVLPAPYFADVGQHVWLQNDVTKEKEAFAYPDSHVTVGSTTATSMTVTRNVTAATRQVRLNPPTPKRVSRYVKIVNKHGHRVVTVIELLSPSNKDPGPDREAYLAKRDDYFRSRTNLVEIDLLRSGERLPMGPHRLPRADYYVLISRTVHFPQAEIWAMTVRDPLPVLPIPLQHPDPDASLDLRQCLDRAFEDNQYGKRLPYDQPPTLPLGTSDAAWARRLLQKRHSLGN